MLCRGPGETPGDSQGGLDEHCGPWWVWELAEEDKTGSILPTWPSVFHLRWWSGRRGHVHGGSLTSSSTSLTSDLSTGWRRLSLDVQKSRWELHPGWYCSLGHRVQPTRRPWGIRQRGKLRLLDQTACGGGEAEWGLKHVEMLHPTGGGRGLPSLLSWVLHRK